MLRQSKSSVTNQSMVEAGVGSHLLQRPGDQRAAGEGAGGGRRPLAQPHQQRPQQELRLPQLPVRYQQLRGN